MDAPSAGAIQAAASHPDWLEPSGAARCTTSSAGRVRYSISMRTVLTSLLFLFGTSAFAAPSSVTTGSIQLIQVKNETAEVPASIQGVTGTVDLQAGTGELTIPINAWDSALKVRDNNVRGTFFQAAEHPTATFTLASLTLQDGVGTAKGTLKMFSGSVPVEASVKVTTDEAGVTTVQTTAPFSVSISGLGLSDNLTALMKLCAHKSVTDAVNAQVSLTLAQP